MVANILSTFRKIFYKCLEKSLTGKIRFSILNKLRQFFGVVLWQETDGTPDTVVAIIYYFKHVYACSIRIYKKIWQVKK